MTSIHTNIQANAALVTLRRIAAEGGDTASRVSTGARVGAASDNASNWSIAATMRGDLKSLAAVKDAINLSLAVIDTAYSASGAVIDNLDGIMADLVQGRNNINNIKPLAALDKDILARAKAISGAIQSASFNGVNLLYHKSGAASTISFVSGATRQGDTYKPQTVSLDLTGIALIDDVPTAGILSKTYMDRYNATSGRRLLPDFGTATWQVSLFPTFGSQTAVPFTRSAVIAHIDIVDQMGKAARDVFASLRALRSRMAEQLSLAANMIDIGTKGMGRLIDADMTRESVRMKAVEVREQLATQALHIANSSPDVILELYRGSSPPSA